MMLAAALRQSVTKGAGAVRVGVVVSFTTIVTVPRGLSQPAVVT